MLLKMAVLVAERGVVKVAPVWLGFNDDIVLGNMILEFEAVFLGHQPVSEYKQANDNHECPN